MDENIKNLREAQQQQKSAQNNDPSVAEEHEVDVDVTTREGGQHTKEGATFTGREDSISDSIGDGLADPISEEQFRDPLTDTYAKTDSDMETENDIETSPKTNKTPMRKLIKIAKNLKLKFGKDAFEDDDPAAYTGLLREMRAMVTHDFSEADIDQLQRFREELRKLWKRAKKSVSDTELSPFEITELDKVVTKIIDIQEVLVESDLPFVLDDIGDVEEGEGDLSRIEDLEENVISPGDQEQLLDEDIYLVEIEEEEATDYQRWSEPVLQLIAVRDPKKVEEV